MHSAAFLRSRRSAWVTPTVTVDFPSPAGVGLIPVTSTRRPLGLRAAKAASRTFALYLPYSSTSSSARPSSAAMSAMGRSFAAWAMAMSVGTLAVVVTGPLGLKRGGEARAEEPSRVFRAPLSEGVERLPADAGERGGAIAHERGLVARATVRHGREVGGGRPHHYAGMRTSRPEGLRLSGRERRAAGRGAPGGARAPPWGGPAAGGGQRAGPAAGGRGAPLRLRDRPPDHHDVSHARGPGTHEHRVPVPVERRIAEMAVGVHEVGAQHAAPLLPHGLRLGGPRRRAGGGGDRGGSEAELAGPARRLRPPALPASRETSG